MLRRLKQVLPHGAAPVNKLRGNKGSQNYVVPADIDPAWYTSVSIWCDPFDVPFAWSPRQWYSIGASRCSAWW